MSKGRRERRRQFITERNKRLRAMDKLRWELWDQMKDLEWIDLPEPIFVGYERTLVIRDDYTRRKDAHLYEELLTHVQNSIRCKRKNFTFKCRKTHKWVEQKLYPKKLKHKEYTRLPSNLQRMFYSTYDYRRGTKSYELMNPYYFQVKTSKHYVTRVKGYDGDLVRREAEIDNYIEQSGFTNVINKMNGYRRYSPYWGRPKPYMDDIETKSFLQDIQDLDLGYDVKHN
jgi:hypothetical protein